MRATPAHKVTRHRRVIEAPVETADFELFPGIARTIEAATGRPDGLHIGRNIGADTLEEVTSDGKDCFHPVHQP